MWQTNKNLPPTTGMVTTRGRLAAQSDPQQEGRDLSSGEGPKASPGGKARRTNKPKLDDDSASTASSSKGKRKSEGKNGLVKARGRGAGGKLRDIMNLPVELFAEVCYYLAPLDLRQLALTNRRMWDILMTKGARNIWKAALSSVAGLPQCPADLNEPQYVCLMVATTVEVTLIGSTACAFAKGALTLTSLRSPTRFRMKNEAGLQEAFKGVQYRSWFPNLTRYLKRTAVLAYVNNYNEARTMYYNSGKQYYIDGIGPVVEKYKALPSRNAEERVAEYTKELIEQSRDRIHTGADMLNWHL
ncbi:hypothetical protein FRC01_009213, partial [Tulasnella sp. 417]